MSIFNNHQHYNHWLTFSGMRPVDGGISTGGSAGRNNDCFSEFTKENLNWFIDGTSDLLKKRDDQEVKPIKKKPIITPIPAALKTVSDSPAQLPPPVVAVNRKEEQATMERVRQAEPPKKTLLGSTSLECKNFIVTKEMGVTKIILSRVSGEVFYQAGEGDSVNFNFLRGVQSGKIWLEGAIQLSSTDPIDDLEINAENGIVKIVFFK